MSQPTETKGPARQGLPGWDALLLALLVIALLQITGLAEAAALPNRVQDVWQHPLLGRLLPEAGKQAMGEIGPRPGDPVGLLLHALTLGFLLGYLVVDLAARGRVQVRLKWMLLVAILATAVFLPTGKLIALRAAHGPASYTHDGGVIQTEAAITYFWQGKNPYREDYVETPMAEWGFSQYRTALYHYPYLPWTFIFSTPFAALGWAVGLYDQRLVYLALLALALALAPRLASTPRRQLALVALLGLNPMMALDVIFGQNDVFVLSWLLFSLVAWHRWQERQRAGVHAPGLVALSAILFGLACASKPTAWFMAPFYGLLLVGPEVTGGGWREVLRAIPTLLRRAAPALAIFGLLIVPYLAWDAAALYDDVWRWSSGQGETGYQIWGWGASNFVLALGLVPDRFAYWPFWIPELLVAVPLLAWLIHRQLRDNTLAQGCWHYGLFLLGFFYVSRFLNENYLGYILAFLAVGILAREEPWMAAGPTPAKARETAPPGRIPPMPQRKGAGS
ncbi:hypothetical protein FKZ61_015625 [Litorilinea aerophila]|uniref:DUF2029 domain-containing protein n=1 Tax=Litorilinea aerophila TaxID=1204385 RepID=A0A540VDA7_9CHLR|nr:hypothetical protein [Litorilinea aerophila]MCC9077531.1 hypothetical protein [Litorilinea aerophila]